MTDHHDGCPADISGAATPAVQWTPADTAEIQATGPAARATEAAQLLIDLNGATDPDRVRQISDALAVTGVYQHTHGELLGGARLAWRNAVNCLGRAHWNDLHVRDARDARTVDDIFDACVEHLRFSTNGGKIRLALTVMPAQPHGHPGWRIWNQQLIRYAGYRQPDGSILGDPDSVTLTAMAQQLGWPGGPGTAFDILPLIIQPPHGQPRWFQLPADTVAEVELSHPDFAWFIDLGLRWYAHPAVSNQLLRIGGIDYPAAPFSGWYTATEIGARNLSDTNRYNVLPAIADQMGLNRQSDRTLWKDRALVELLRAVIHSYDEHGVTIVDHHFAARTFVRHEEREARRGRTVPARLATILAPTAASTTALYTRTYSDDIRLPNFFPLTGPQFTMV